VSNLKIFRADVVGSMLRPDDLSRARAGVRAGEMDAEECRALEDRAVDDALRIQEKAGVDVVSDGEIRRGIFYEFFETGATGVNPAEGWVVRFKNAESDNAMAVAMPSVVTEKLRGASCPAVAEFEYAQARTSRPVKVALPSPTLVSAYWTHEGSAGAYADVFELMADATEVVKAWIEELAAAGCRYIQIDSPEFLQVHADPDIREEYAARGIDVDRYMAEGAEFLEAVTTADVPDATILGLHVCKGNGTRSWLAAGGYDELAREFFARAPGYDVFQLEFDDERSGSFEPLRHLPDDKVCVLGLVSTKWQALEDPAQLRARIHEAARFHPLEQLALSTQCGFASASETADQRLVTWETQGQKLKLVAETARSVWA
jgi:5-methyltetrahydropteroyltriglutamate--homocysteine methyltransferase